MQVPHGMFLLCVGVKEYSPLIALLIAQGLCAQRRQDERRCYCREVAQR